MSHIIKPYRGTILNYFHPLARGLVGAWIINELNGSKLFDSVRGDNIAILRESSFWRNGGIQCTGDLDYIDTEKDISEFLSSRGTIVLGYKYIQAPTAPFWWSAQSDYAIFSLYFSYSTYWNLVINSSNLTNRPNDQFFNDGNYHTIAGTWDDDSNIRNVYRDSGILVLTDTTSFTWASPTAKFYMGGRNYTGRDCGGIVYFYYCYDRVLSPEEIAQIHSDPYVIFGFKTPVWAFYESEDPEPENKRRSAISHFLLTAMPVPGTTSSEAYRRQVAGYYGGALEEGLINLSASILGQTNTSSIDLSITRALSVAISGNTSVSTAALLITRALNAAIAAVTGTSSPATDITRDLSASVSGQSSTSIASLTISRILNAAITGQTSTSNINLDILREMNAAAAAQTQTSTPALEVLRNLSSIISGVTVTSDITLTIEGIINLAATIAGITVTSTPALDVSRELTAGISGQIQTSAITLSVLREISAAIAGAINAPDITMDAGRKLSASIAGTSDISDITLNVNRNLNASVSAQITTSSIALLILRAMQAAIETGATTSQAALTVMRELSVIVSAETLTSAISLIIAGMGVLTDTTIESLTVKRLITSITAVRKIESLTAKRNIEET